MSHASRKGAAARFRAAVIGCGPVGKRHARSIHDSVHADLVAVCDTDRDRADQLAAELASTAAYEYQSLLAATRLDVVTVATPNHLHVDPVLAALATGCHVFCEKPLAPQSVDARRMVEDAERRHVYLAVNYNRRFGFGYQQCRQLLDAGSIGAVRQLLIRVTDGFPRPHIAREPEVMLTTLLTHHIDLVRFLGAEIRSVHATFAARGPNELVCDVVLALTLDGGAVAVVTGGYRGGQTRTLEQTIVSGTEGQLVVDDVTRRVRLHRLDIDHVEEFTPNHFQTPGDSFYATIDHHLHHFLSSIAVGDAPRVTGHDGLRGIQVAEAAIESQRTGRVVDLPAKPVQQGFS